jgi:2-polyprenyl-3-methyl-5-hydroxy-6-metoxy-1,4-benzoquinol methylase
MNHFDHSANEWDSPDKIQMMENLAARAKENMQLNNDLDILDFGCGTGLFGLAFYDHAKTLTGIDTSQGMLEVFKNKTQHVTNVEHFNIDLEVSDHAKKYDLIVSSMAFHHLNSPNVMLAKFKQMLKPQGQIAIVDLDQEDGSFHPDNQAMGVKHFGFSKEELTNWARESNYTFSHSIINKIEKNGKQYAQFLAIYS